jgi:CubicO group peptidase (beta-lactamase class C family)
MKYLPFVNASLPFAVMLLSACRASPTDSLADRIDAVLRPAYEAGRFSGNVLITRRDQVVYERSFGQADLEKNIPNTAGTRFLGFSVVKPLTAVLVFQQLEAGKLHLTDTLESFFPDLRGKSAGRLTLQQLLTHTSGISEVISGHLDRRITPRDLAAATVDPKAGFEYSSTGYVCLGLVLEAVTGRSYESLLQEKILDPAGMKDSGLMRTDRGVPGLARGYHRVGNKVAPAELGVAMEALDGAGSLFTTARDLWRFDQALEAETLLSRRMQDLMVSQQVKGRYGYGWFLAEQGGRYFPWHKGDFRGYTAVLVRQIHRKETIVILSNLEETDVLGLRTKLLQILKAEPTP